MWKGDFRERQYSLNIKNPVPYYRSIKRSYRAKSVIGPIKHNLYINTVRYFFNPFNTC